METKKAVEKIFVAESKYGNDIEKAETITQPIVTL